MTTQCPRCGTPRPGEYPICQGCGLDFRYLIPPPMPAPGYVPQMGYVPATPPADPQPAPTPVQAAQSVCLRCYTPLYPGYTKCSNCGFENSTAFSAPPAAPARNATLPIVLAAIGVGLLVAAVVLVAVAGQGSSATPSSSYSPSPVSVVATTKPPPTDSTPSASGGSAASATAEPSPLDNWTAYASADGKWSARFPGLSSPRASSQTVSAGTSSVSATIYAVEDMNGADYGVEVAEFPSTFVSGSDAEALLANLVTTLAADWRGKVAGSVAATQAGLPARDAAISVVGALINVRVWFVGSRMYGLLTQAARGIAVYPQHFYAEFALK